MHRPLYTFQPQVRKEALDKVKGAFESNYIGMGPKVTEFECRLAREFGFKHVVCTNSCTSAIDMALALLKIGAVNGGNCTDEVITTPYTFVAANHCILRAGARPVFIDIDLETYNVRADRVEKYLIEKCLTGRVKAVLPVHMFGLPCNMDRINSAAAEHGVPVIEDCAHALGARRLVDGAITPIGADDDNLHCFSFQALKNLTTGDGGALVCADHRLAEECRSLRWFGIDRNDPQKSVDGTYDVPYVGGMWAMNDVAAAVGLAQLDYFWLDRLHRRKLVREYADNLKELPVILPASVSRYGHAWHAYTIRTSNRVRDAINHALRCVNIYPTILYRPSYYYRQFEEFSADRSLIGNLEAWTNDSNCERAYRESLTLPLHTNMTVGDVREVCDIIRRVITGHWKEDFERE